MSKTHETLSNDDWVSLTRLVHELAWRIDYDPPSVGDLFDPTSSFSFIENAPKDPDDPTPTDVHGRETARKWAADRAKIQRRTRHVVSNLWFVATGPDTVSGTSVITIYMHDGPGTGEPIPLTVGEYRDTYARQQDGQWLVTSRHLERLFDSRALSA
jgi:hypothetical protein